MPADQRGQPYRTTKGWGLRYYDERGVRRRQPGFSSKSEARQWFDNVERPRQLGLPTAVPDVTLSEFVEQFLAAKKATVEPITVRTLRERLAHATKAFGDVRLRDLQHRSREIAEWSATLGASRYRVMNALRQCLDAAVRWKAIGENPAKAAGRNPQPKAKEITPFMPDEIDRIAVELGPWGPLAIVAAETALMPEEWIALERRDVLREAAVVLVERVCVDGQVKPYGKTARRRRRVPLSARALDALGRVPPRLDSRLLFPAEKGGYVWLDSWRSREWYPALEAAGLAKRGPYALRHTGITNMLAAGVPIFDVARYAGTSVQMIERTYGHLAKGSEEHARRLLAAYHDRLGQERAAGEEQG